MRLLPDMQASAATLMATDEAILTAITENKSPPTVRFYQWTPPAVTIGYFQNPQKEVDLEYLKQNKIDLVRRITGGGAVYHDKELTYTLFVPTDQISEDILESYKIICGAIVNGLKTIGINAQFSPINDLLINNKKFSGNAQTRKNGIIMQHGTILLEVDKDKMFSVLNITKEKISDKQITELKQRVTSLSAETKIKDFAKVRNALVEGFEQQFNTEFTLGQLTEYEIRLQAESIIKYQSKEWTYKR